MSGYALKINDQYNLSPAFEMNSWSQFARKFSSATSILPAIPLGKFLEIGDKKFQGESLIVFRRTDFDNLNMFSSMASKVSRCLMQIDRMTTTFEDSTNPKSIIKLIHEEAKIGIEFTVVPTTTTANDYFQTITTATDDEEVTLPGSRDDIEG